VGGEDVFIKFPSIEVVKGEAGGTTGSGEVKGGWQFPPYRISGDSGFENDVGGVV